MSCYQNCYLTINNLTSTDFAYAGEYFSNSHCSLASGYSWPMTIQAGETTGIIQCCASGALHQCSGYVLYNLGTTYGNAQLTFSFGNPVVGTNTAAFGAASCASDSSASASVYPVSTVCQLNGSQSNTYITCETRGTPHGSNNCSWNVQIQDYSVVPGNIQLTDVVSVYNNINGNSSAQTYYYFRCADLPVSGGNYVWSHFKGLGFIGDRMVMTHTNLHPALGAFGSNSQNGWFLYADNPLALISSYPAAAPTGSSSNPCFITATIPTQYSGWLHPCSLQVCGTFLAMGIQSGSSASTSVIQIWDARNALLNLPFPSAALLHTIQRSNAINGVGMTQATNGDYIVAAVQGSVVDVYLSTGSDLFASSLDFNMVKSFSGFNASGAGLALVTQEDGDIYLFALNASNTGNNQVSLYQLLNVQGSNPSNCQLTQIVPPTAPAAVDITRDTDSDPVSALEGTTYANLLANHPLDAATLLTIKGNVGGTGLTSYRWGKGLRIVSSNTVEIYATDRNVMPWSQIAPPTPGVDWSMLVLTATGSSSGSSMTTTNADLGKA